MNLEKINLNKYKNLVFYVRGDYDKCFTTRFKLEIKGIDKVIRSEKCESGKCCPCLRSRKKGNLKEGDTALYEIEGVDTQWRQVIVPLEEALREGDFSEAYRFAIIFDDAFVTSKLGRIYIDNIYLTDEELVPSNGILLAQFSSFNTPPKVVFTAPQSACLGKSITLDARGTKDDQPECLTFFWDLGDGTKAEGETVTKVYDRLGTYNVTLYVNDNQCTRCSKGVFSKTIKVNRPPVAEAGEDVILCLNAMGEYKVEFDGSHSYDPDGDNLSYAWDFGDGSKASKAIESKVIHIYKKGGSYIARLTIDDGSDSECKNSEDTVNIRLNTAPLADAGPNLVCCVDVENIFDGSKSHDPDGDNLSYSWDFGDGTKAEGVKVKHAYTQSGTYNVTLTVKDGSGMECGSSVDSFVVTVNTKPVPRIKIR
ncbi:MAG: PKD domain-containing protein [Candidatus Omnitrophica bacterium]|nr:PKD domain-containing protein [Candidatus Omnitrophota bacterium]